MCTSGQVYQYRLSFVVIVVEPIPYPKSFPHSFAYVRQQLDLYSVLRVNSVVTDPLSGSRRDPRELTYVFDDFFSAKKFMDRVKEGFPGIRIRFQRKKSKY